MKISPEKAFVSAILAVTLVPAAIVPFLSGYGTTFAQAIGLLAWGAVTLATSAAYPESHLAAVWSAAFALNLLCFLIPAGLVWFLLRTRWPLTCAVSFACLGALQLLFLFVLFPASIGP
jgi:hypothetical protein